MAAFNGFNQTIADIANKQHDLGSDTFKFMLTLVTPTASNSIRADLTEIAAGNGYAAGGEAVVIASSEQVAGAYSWVGGNSPVITATGGAIADFRYVVLYNDTSTDGKLIGYYDYGSTLTVSEDETFTINANGITLISGALTAV